MIHFIPMSDKSDALLTHQYSPICLGILVSSHVKGRTPSPQKLTSCLAPNVFPAGKKHHEA